MSALNHKISKGREQRAKETEIRDADHWKYSLGKDASTAIVPRPPSRALMTAVVAWLAKDFEVEWLDLIRFAGRSFSANAETFSASAELIASLASEEIVLRSRSDWLVGSTGNR